MDLKLEFPNETHREMYENLVSKWKQFGDIPKESNSIFRHEDFDSFLSEKQADIRGREGLVPATFFFLTYDNEIIGHLQVRHHIEHQNLKEMGGHIGYTIVPWERKKGYGKKQLELGLIEAKKLGLTKVMISCLSDNIASENTILANGGKDMTEIILETPPKDRQDEKGKKLKRYWITL